MESLYQFYICKLSSSVEPLKLLLSKSNFDQTMATNRSDLIEQNELIVTIPQTKKFKIATIFDHALKNKFFQEFIKFGIYTILLLLILSLLNKTGPSAIYSIVEKEQTERSIFMRKQIPGLFPPLNTDEKAIVNKWKVRLLRGPDGPQQFVSSSYQLQFKHFNEKQDVVYITRDSCNGHLIMNWETYGSNIYFTEYVPPNSSMIIPNQPEDEACIKKDSEVLELLKFSSVWTVSEQNEKTALFLLIEKTSPETKNSNYVLVADIYKKP